jgi:arylsulfatase
MLRPINLGRFTDKFELNFLKLFVMIGVRVFIRFIITVVLFSTLGCRTSEKEEESLPNIILILADDMGWSDPGCYGSEISTPNLDHLAENGMRFTQVYNTSKCYPSRACLLTGVYAQQSGFGSSFRNPIANAITLGEMLRMAGYRTLWSGKHHGVENPVTRGFDRYYGLRDGACNYFNPGRQRPGEGVPAQKRDNRHWCFDELEMAPYTPEEKDFYTTDYFTNYALEWLEEYKSEERPFFLYLAYNAPHDPLMAWPEDIAKYEGVYDEGYGAIRQARFEKQKAMGLLDDHYELSEPTYKDWDALTEVERTEEISRMTVYAAMVDRLDQNIGRVLKKMEELGKADNTLVLFASDNGASSEVVNINSGGVIGTMERWSSQEGSWANVSNTPLRFYKNYSYEGGIRTPLIACWPSVITQKGAFSDSPLHFIDLMATFVDIAGVDYPEQYQGQTITPMQGISFLPELKGEKINRGEPLFWQWKNGKAIRLGDWKLVAWKDRWELYDLLKDPVEANNVIGDHPRIAEKLKTLYEAWAIEVGNDKQ